MDPGLTTLSGPKFSLQAPLLELKVDSRQREAASGSIIG